MGQACGYICNKKEGESDTYVFPDQKGIGKKSSFEEISNQEFSKAYNKRHNDFLSSAYNSNITSNVDDNMRTQEQLKKIFGNKLIMYKFIKLQSIIRGSLTRKRIKIHLAEHYKAILITNYENFDIRKIEDFEAKFANFNNFESQISNNGNNLTREKTFFNKMLLQKYSFYVGEVNLKNEKHGYGRLITKDCTLFLGNWVRNQFTGKGRKIDSKGILYEGNFENNVLTGQNGKTINPYTNYNYIGEFLNSMKHGYGTEECEEYSYEGNFIADKKGGNGKIKYKLKNDIYVGNFSDDAINGVGSYTWANNHVYTGSFVDGKMEGQGTYIWPTGEEYTGDYKNNIKMGLGVFKWPNGKVFEGPFVNGNPNGEGKLTYEGKMINAKFIDGKLDSSTLNERGPKFKRRTTKELEKKNSNLS